MFRLSYFFVVILFWSCRSLSVAEAESPDVLVSDKSVFDFGAHDTTKKIQHTFVIKNVSTATVSIEDIKAACGCTAAKVSSKVLAPGETADVAVTLDLWGMRGWVHKPVLLMGGGKPLLSLVMQGTVTRSIEVLPDQLRMGDVAKNNVEERWIIVAAKGTDKIRVTNAAGTNDAVRCVVEPLVEGKVYAIKVTLLPKSGTLEIQDRIRILLDDPNNPVVEVPLTAKIIHRINILPTSLVIGGSGADATPRFIVFREQAQGQFDLQFKANPNVAVELQRTREGYRAKVTPTSKWADLHGEELIFQSNVSELEKIQIPISVASEER